MPSLDPYDAVLLLSFGGPEGPADVLPFLENVTRGRGIPRERLMAVAEHYDAVGGRSPINDQNRALLAALADELTARGHEVPLAWGNRNWAPYVTDALRDLHQTGARRVLAITTSAYSSYSSCRQYREDLGQAVLALADEGREVAVDRVPAYFDLPEMTEVVGSGVLAALAELPADRGPVRLVFVTHSIPLEMAETAGPDGGAYVAQHREIAAEVARGVAAAGGPSGWDLAFCSRSGRPEQPWLEPDVNDHLRALRDGGTKAAVLVPVGFVSDHMEVVHDLDTEALATAREIGLAAVRAPTVGVAPAFVRGLVDRLERRAERARTAPGQRPEERWPSVCRSGCCANPRAERPAAGGEDWRQPVLTQAGS